MMKAMKEVVQEAVVYNRQEHLGTKGAKFKPGNDPSYQLGNEVLNGQINWLNTMQEVLGSRKFTINSLSQYLEVKTEVVKKVLENDLSCLNFKTGAKLLGVHESLGVQ